MKTNTLLGAFLTVFAVVAVLHGVAEVKGLYYTLWWMDILTHFLGGAVVGFGSLWLGGLIGVFPPVGERESRIGGIRFVYENGIPSWATCCVVLVGIGIVAPVWELLEVIIREVYGLTWVGMPYPLEYVSDTISDIIMGFSGAIIAWAVAHKVQWIVWQEAKAPKKVVSQHQH